jgi:hypothetical protein
LCCSYDTLVAGGGDGTLNELVVALLQHKAPSHITVAQLPLGTANDLASAAGISLVSGSRCVTWPPGGWQAAASCGQQSSSVCCTCTSCHPMAMIAGPASVSATGSCSAVSGLEGCNTTHCTCYKFRVGTTNLQAAYPNWSQDASPVSPCAPRPLPGLAGPI